VVDTTLSLNIGRLIVANDEFMEIAFGAGVVAIFVFTLMIVDSVVCNKATGVGTNVDGGK
jgi:hypothetical protein